MITTACLKANSENKQNRYNIFFKHQINPLNMPPVNDTLYYLKDKFLEKNMIG